VANSSYKLIRDDTLEKMTDTLKALALPMRLNIVYLLMDGERSVGDIVKTTGMNQSPISKQLSILKFNGVLKSRRNGNVTYYFIERKGIKKILAAIFSEL
jgi:DNA-binding transcriptional ArsR family regulator